MNDENLVPNSNRTPSERRENARKAGVASGAARRRKKTMAELVPLMLDSAAPGKPSKAVQALFPDVDGEITWGAQVVAGQVNAAAKGSTQAARWLQELQGAGGAAEAEGARPFERDFVALAADPFLPLHRECLKGRGCDAWIKGGRASAKSSYVSLEVVDLLMRHPEYSALVMMRLHKDMRSSVYEQMKWAVAAMGVEGEWEFTVSPMRALRKATGQVVTFKGCDKAGKTKGLKAPAGTYYAVLWLEEVDQFAGMAEVRTVYQSVTRGAGEGSPFYRFHTYNPPRSRDSWANREAERRREAGMRVVTSNYLDVPEGWLPEQVLADVEALKAADTEAYRHEWLGEAVGYGAEVFPRAVVREVTEEEREVLRLHYYGVDWGFSADPWVWVRIGYDRATRTLYVLDEMSGRGLSNAQTAEMVAARMEEAGEPYAAVACDSAEPKSIADYRACGIRASAAPKQGPHNVRNSLRWLQDRAAIVIDPRCKVAAAEFPAYCWEMTPDGEQTGNAPDRDNHAIDAVRYAAATLIADRTCV